MVPATAPSSGRTIRRRHTETRRSRSSGRPVATAASRLPALMFPPVIVFRRRTRTAFPFKADYGMDISWRKDDYARRRHEGVGSGDDAAGRPLSRTAGEGGERSEPGEGLAAGTTLTLPTLRVGSLPLPRCGRGAFIESPP